MRVTAAFSLAVLISLVVTDSCTAQGGPGLGLTGRVQDNLQLNSELLGGPRKYAVYLPPDYNSSERSYPVLYLLHGSGDDHTGWVQFGEVLHIADKAIAEGTATAMVIVMPDGDSGRKGYFNDVRGDWPYEDFFFDELIPQVEKRFRIKSSKRYRAIAGLSMGGGGTFMYALHRPEMFSSACPLSASVGPLDMDAAQKYYAREKEVESGKIAADSLPALPGDKDIEAYRAQHCAVDLVESMPVKELKSVRWFIDCGDDDFLYEGNSLVHIALRKKKIYHEYRVRNGAHNWTYWRESLPEVLRFVSDAFHQH